VTNLSQQSPKVEAAARTTVQGVDLVRTKIDNLPAQPAPPPFHQQDVTLSWLDWPPYQDAEEAYRGGAEDVRSALAKYQTDTTNALLALPRFPEPDDRDEPDAQDRWPRSASWTACRSAAPRWPGGAPLRQPDGYAQPSRCVPDPRQPPQPGGLAVLGRSGTLLRTGRRPAPS